MNKCFSGFQTAHAASLLNLANNKVLLSFHGNKNKQDHQSIWIAATNEAGQWSDPYNITPNGSENHWNPVLFQADNGKIWLFFKIGTIIEEWKGSMLISNNEGQSWSQPYALPGNSVGPTRNPPLKLQNDWILIPSNKEKFNRKFPVFERFNCNSGDIQQIPIPVKSEDPILFAIQPTLVQLPDQSILALCRTNLKRIYQTISVDEGKTWSPLSETEHPNPNSAITTLKIKDGYYLVMNPSPTNRGHIWVIFIPWKGKAKHVFELYHDGKAIAYPSLIALNEKNLLIAYSINQQEITVKQLNLKDT